MKTFEITSAAGEDMGTYAAASENDALDKMARAAGYSDYQETLDRGVAPFDGTIREVDPSVGVDWFIDEKSNTAFIVDATGQVIEEAVIADDERHEAHLRRHGWITAAEKHKAIQTQEFLWVRGER